MAIKKGKGSEDHVFRQETETERYYLNTVQFSLSVIHHSQKIDPYDILALVYFRIQH